MMATIDLTTTDSKQDRCKDDHKSNNNNNDDNNNCVMNKIQTDDDVDVDGSHIHPVVDGSSSNDHQNNTKYNNDHGEDGHHDSDVEHKNTHDHNLRHQHDLQQLMIDEVVLVGGSSRVPCLRDTIRRVCGRMGYNDFALKHGESCSNSKDGE